MNRTIVLIEGNLIGHPLTYVKLFAATLLDLGYRVVVFCPKPDEVMDWLNQHRGDMSGRCLAYTFSHRDFPSGCPGIVRAAFRWQAAASAITKVTDGNTPPFLVFFCFLDSYMARYLPPWLVDLLFPFPWSGLYISPEHLRLPSRKASWRDLALLSDTCRSVALLDEGVSDALAEELNGKTVVSFPDFADLSAPNLKYPPRNLILEQAAGRKVVGLLGCLYKRKGTLTLLDVAELMKEEPFFFVFAGVIYREDYSETELARIDHAVAARPENVLFSFSYIPDETSFNALVEVCDIVFAAYNDFPHSSNLLTKASHFRKPVIVNDGFCMAERVRKYRLGVVANGDGAHACADAIRRAASAVCCEQAELPDYQRYAEEHSLERLAESFSLLLSKEG